MPIQITARRDGFRRLGMSHSADGRTWPDDKFTAEELAVLENDPNLIVVRVSDASEPDTGVVTLLTGQRDGLREQVSELKGDLDAANNIIKSLMGERDALQVKLDAANSTITTITAERDALQVKPDAATTPVAEAEPAPESQDDKATSDVTASAGKKKG